jgi:gliding motility-associated lipoprotein GldD
MIYRKSLIIISTMILLAGLTACEGSYSPKPRGYFRIDLPKKTYESFDTSFPFTFDYPSYAKITPDYQSPNEKYWINIEFPNFKGSLHISYKTINGNLINYLEDSRSLVMKHIPKASSIQDSMIYLPGQSVYGMIYHIQGAGVASPTQFFLTDSTSHFLRGALYFNIRPNNDSLAPVISFVNQDITRLINSFRWK